MYERAGKGLTQTQGGVKSKEFEDSRSLEKKTDAYSEIADIFPALQKYKDEHNTANLQKLMVEILFLDLIQAPGLIFFLYKELINGMVG